MTAMFWTIDVMLMTFGCSINLTTKSNLFLIINWIFRLWLILDTIHHLIVKLHKPSHMFTGIMEDISFTTAIIVTQVILTMKHFKIRHMLRKITSRVDVYTQQYLTILSILLVIRYSFSLMVGFGYTLTILTNNALYEKSIRNYLFWVNEYTSLHRAIFTAMRWFKGLCRDLWFLIGLTIYVYIAVAIERLTYQRMEFGLRANSLDDMHQLLHIKQRIVVMKEEFEGTFNLLPLIWLNYIFQSATGTFATHGDVKTWFLVELVQSLITVFGAIFFINYNRNRCHQLNRRILIRFLNKWNLNTCPNIEYIKSELLFDIEYTAFGLFKLDNGLILSFMSGLVTFTVMFLQMKL